MAAKDHSGQRRTSLICFSKCTRCRNTSELRISLAVLLAPWSAVRSSRCFRFAPPFFGGSRTQKMREHSHCTVVSSCFSTAWRLSPQLGHLNAPRVRCFGFGTRT